MPNRMTCDFGDKPRTQAYADLIVEFTMGLGAVRREEKAQLSFAVGRKFLWLWTYERTADGILDLSVTLDRAMANDAFRSVTEVAKNRWNHHVIVHTKAEATSGVLHDLIRAGYDFGSG
ncbi:DUF5655 domain-containing protein [Microbacterium sp. ARD32]|uniref:DUF5655 domain-containing protein n=1 Tax=Microbacterium sp. ARD32 TaxID=2962577 RepID=UPI002882A3B5|nr:DUF5655 domain-containing protein [Microbacterium sp. ARD32]MDT0157655.1 DUF5655 domain-containing protein [Microbacterium sp. ARD32]